MTEIELEWAEPPAHILAQKRSTRYTPVAGALREHPGRWAKLPGTRTEGSAKGTALNIRTGKIAAFTPAGSFDARVDGTTVYVQYCGPVDDDGVAETRQERPGDVPQAAPAVDADSPTGAVVREWARGNGYQVPDKGRLSAALVESYKAAQLNGQQH